MTTKSKTTKSKTTKAKTTKSKTTKAKPKPAKTADSAPAAKPKAGKTAASGTAPVAQPEATRPRTARRKTGRSRLGGATRARRTKPTKTEEEFDVWMFHMDEALAQFMSRLPDDVRRELDYSVASLDVLEAWLMDRYPDIEATRAETDSTVFDGAARYIGETFCKTLGGEWWVDPKGKIMHGLPHVGRFRSTGKGAGVPLTLATASTDRRKGNMISGVWRRQIAWIAGVEERSPFLDDKQYRKHTKVTPEEELFQYWLDQMDSELAHLLALVPAGVRARLDLSAGSLDVIEAWLLARYPDGEAARAETEVLVLDGVARYVGETFRKTLGGQWWFDLEGWTHNGLPQVVGFADAADAGPVCPLRLAHAAADARRGDVFRSALRARHPGGGARN